jgi:oligopeptide transport system substrate-binding protein
VDRYELEAVVTRSAVTRRTVLATSLISAACRRKAGPYFGRAIPPSVPRLRFALAGETDSIDPAYQTGGNEMYLLPPLFEGLTAYHPATLTPLAALATHFEAELSPPRLTFYLRGHPSPRGQALANTDTLRAQYRSGILKQDLSRGLKAPPDSKPALWSDGRFVTAHDFVFSWRRLADPRTAAPYAFMLSAVRNAAAIQAGNLGPERLGVDAVDDFTLRIETTGPPVQLLPLLPVPALAAVPRWAIESARQLGRESDWTHPDRIVTSGAFLLERRRPYERTVLVRNPRYYEADLVGLETVEFALLADGVVMTNLYRAGCVDFTAGGYLSPLLEPMMETHPDFHVTPAYFVIWHSFNIGKPPFDNVLLRYALNMAIDKAAIAKAIGSGRRPAYNIIPPKDGYDCPNTLKARVDGVEFDVLAYNPDAARALLAKAGFAEGLARDGQPLRFDILIPNVLPHSRPIAEMTDNHWRRNLGIAPRIVVQEFSVWIQSIVTRSYSGVCEGGGWPDYYDPKAFFDWYANGSQNSGTGYADRVFDELLARADTVADPLLRLQAMANCERHLLASMPVIPILHNVFAYLQKPFVSGMEGNALDKHPLKYAWIDTNWRPPE